MTRYPQVLFNLRPPFSGGREVSIGTMVAAIFLLGAPSNSFAQDQGTGRPVQDPSVGVITPIGSMIWEGPIGEPGRLARVYMPAHLTPRTFYYSPMFAFEANGGDLAVQVEPLPLDKSRASLALTLLVSPAYFLSELKTAICIDAERTGDKSGYSKDLSSSPLVSTPFSHIIVSPNDSDVNFFERTERVSSGVRLRTRSLTLDEANQYKNWLISNVISFKIEYDVVAMSVSTAVQAVVEGLVAKISNDMIDLVGDDSAFVISDQSAKLTAAAYLSESGRKQFFSTVDSHMNTYIALSQSQNLTPELQRQLSEFLKRGRVFVEKPINIDDQFAAEIAKISALGVGRRVLNMNSSRLNSISAEVRNFFASGEETFSSERLGAAASLFGIADASVDMRLSRNELRNKMEAAGWQFGVVSNNGIAVPVSLKVHLVDKVNLHAAASDHFRVDLFGNPSLVRFTDGVATSDRGRPRTPPAESIVSEQRFLNHGTATAYAWDRQYSVNLQPGYELANDSVALLPGANIMTGGGFSATARAYFISTNGVFNLECRGAPTWGCHVHNWGVSYKQRRIPKPCEFF